MSSVLSSLNLTEFSTNDVSDSARSHRWVILIDGTWCDHKPNKNTMVGILSELVETSNFQIVRYYAGIGTYSSYSDRFVGGLTGWGIRRRLFKIFCDLVQEYHEGDEIVVIGYSRGAFMANTLANLLNCVGIPQPWTEDILKECFELFWTNKLYELEERRKCKERCHSLEAPIQFLGCLDTVGSLGVPNTGILTPLKCIPRFIRHLQFRSTDLSDNVHVFRQYLALDEYRAIFEPTLMHVDIEAPQNIIQEWFAGSHWDMGRVSPDGTGLGNIVLRRMIEHLSSVNVRFDESQFEKHFRKYSGGRTNLSVENAQEWIHARPRNTWTIFWGGGGLKKRVPGWYGRKGKKTNEVIHPSVYYRELAKHGNPRKYPSLPGHTRCSNPDGSYVWKKGGSWNSTGSWSSNSSRASRGLDMSVVPEGAPGVLEGLLGGYSLPELL